MAYDLKEREEPATVPVHRDRASASLARVPTPVWALLAVLLAAVAFLTWRAYFAEKEGDVVGSAMLAFEKQNTLNVFSSRFEVVAESVNTPSVGPFDIDALQSRQAMIVPATVEYRLDLSQMTRGNFAWNPDNETLDVTLPPLGVSTPNVDEKNARIFTDGVWISRDAATQLSANNSAQAERKALAFARNHQVMGLARNAAKDAIRQNLTIPLQVAGYGDVAVNVRFADE